MTILGDSPMIVSVIGLMGSGKTHTITALEKKLSQRGIPVKNLQEPVELWLSPFNFLKETEEKTTFKPISQGYIFTTMMNMIQKEKYFNGVLLIERSICNGIHEFSFDEMNPLVRHFYYELGKLEREMGVDLIVNVNTSVPTSINRVIQRGRSGELETVSMNSYLQQLDMRHRDFVNIIKYLCPNKLIELNENDYDDEFDKLVDIISSSFLKRQQK